MSSLGDMHKKPSVTAPSRTRCQYSSPDANDARYVYRDELRSPVRERYESLYVPWIRSRLTIPDQHHTLPTMRCCPGGPTQYVVRLTPAASLTYPW